MSAPLKNDRNYAHIPGLLERVRHNEEAATKELCELLRSGIRFLVLKRVGYQDCEDAIQDVLLEVLQAIRQDKVQHPIALLAFARTIAVRKSAALIRHIVTEKTCTTLETIEGDISAPACTSNPESAYFDSERTEIAYRVLARLKPLERAVLQRFYVDEQSQEQICTDLNLTDAQFRLLKSRAKAKFGELGRAWHNRKPTRTAARGPLPAIALRRCA